VTDDQSSYTTSSFLSNNLLGFPTTITAGCIRISIHSPIGMSRTHTIPSLQLPCRSSSCQFAPDHPPATNPVDQHTVTTLHKSHTSASRRRHHRALAPGSCACTQSVATAYRIPNTVHPSTGPLAAQI